METVRLDEVELAYRIVGDGPQLMVLLHGWPQTHACWRKVVEPLSRHWTVVAPDLRGYGASGLADTGYDKRATASDMSGLIAHLGYEKAVVVGHDRGARVAHRWALDRPGEISALALLDILPTTVVMDTFDRDSATAMWHWFFHRQSELATELISANVEPYLRHFLAQVLRTGAVDAATFADYVAAYSDPGHLRASMEDYRTGFTDDLERDRSDLARGHRLTAPLLVLWGDGGGLARHDVVKVWSEHHLNPAAVRGHPVPGGHYIPEEAPEELLDALGAFLTDASQPGSSQAQ